MIRLQVYLALTGAHMAVGAPLGSLRPWAFPEEELPLFPLGIAVLGICAMWHEFELAVEFCGTYQLMKLGSAPLSVALYASVYGRKFDRQEIASLALVILGIYIVTRGRSA